jgi:hypothetical protein
MSRSENRDPPRLAGRIDVLSVDEEGILSALRDLTAQIGARGQAVDRVLLEQSLSEAGAIALGIAEDGESVQFRFHEVLLSLHGIPRGGVEVSFPGTR